MAYPKPPARLPPSPLTLHHTAVAIVDAVLDLVYSVLFVFAAAVGSRLMLPLAFPSSPLEALSLFYPTAHIVFVARSVEQVIMRVSVGRPSLTIASRPHAQAAAEVASRKRRAGDEGNGQERRDSLRTAVARTGRIQEVLPRWKAVRFAVVALGSAVVGLFVASADR